jgi:hypothetical protein
LKIAATIFLIFSIFVQTFSTFIIQADFYLNRSYIAKNLCVNKDKPVMHCNGKCYLSKKLKEQEKQDQQAPAPRNEKFDITLFFPPELFTLENSVVLLKKNFFLKNESAVASLPHSIFHPPSA